jgi:adenylate cyclase
VDSIHRRHPLVSCGSLASDSNPRPEPTAWIHNDTRKITQLVGLGGSHGLELPRRAFEIDELPEPIAVEFALLEGKDIGKGRKSGIVTALSSTAGVVSSDAAVEELSNLRIEVTGGSGEACYAKFVSISEAEGSFVIRFTSGALTA